MMNAKKDEIEDRQWFDALTGRSNTSDADSTEVEREAQLLRAAILAEHQEQKNQNDDAQADYERLLFKLKREGVLNNNEQNKTKQASTIATSSLWRMSFPKAMAAAIAMAIIIPVTYQITRETSSTDTPVATPIAQVPLIFENPTAKATLNELSVIHAIDPEAAVTQITQALQQLDINSTAYMLNGMWHIEASTGSAAPSEDLIQLAQQHGFILSDNGKINIRIEPQRR